jgi:Domain of unknown function (DUF1918)
MTSGEMGLHASPGDHLVIRGHRQGESQRDGEIVAVLGQEGKPPYLVRWEDGHEAEVFPASDAYVRRTGRPGGD